MASLTSFPFLSTGPYSGKTDEKCRNMRLWRNDDDVKQEDYLQWVNKPCPKCGGNLLTEEDYNSAQILHMAADFINELSLDELKEIPENVSPEELEAMKKNPMFAQLEWPESETEKEKPMNVKIETNGTGEMVFTNAKKDEH